MPIVLNGTTGITTPGINNTGTSTFAAGSAAAPSIAPNGDPNTGIFFPAADTIAFSEGGTEAMRLTSTGNVGIGTNDPQVKFEVRGNVRVGYGSEQGLITAEGFGAKLVLNQTGGEGSTTTELRAEGLLLSFGTDLTLQTASYNLIFKTNFTERFRIGTSGQFGIGGANYGNSGQVLTSNGSGAAPSWQAAASGAQDYIVQSYGIV
jgi:hypothetical protein